MMNYLCNLPTVMSLTEFPCPNPARLRYYLSDGVTWRKLHRPHPRMKNLFLPTSALIAGLLLAPVAAFAAKPETPKASNAKLIEKYDTNKNGKLDGDEIARDQERLPRRAEG